MAVGPVPWRPRLVVSQAERRRVEIARRQAEWAETYLYAIANLELDDLETRRLVHELRDHLRHLEARLIKLGES